MGFECKGNFSTASRLDLAAMIQIAVAFLVHDLRTDPLSARHFGGDPREEECPQALAGFTAEAGTAVGEIRRIISLRSSSARPSQAVIAAQEATAGVIFLIVPINCWAMPRDTKNLLQGATKIPEKIRWSQGWSTAVDLEASPYIL
jgi:hypothetical protein